MKRYLGPLYLTLAASIWGGVLCSQQGCAGSAAGAGTCLDSICSGAGDFGAICPVFRRIMANPAPNASIGRLDRYHRLFYFHLGAVREICPQRRWVL